MCAHVRAAFALHVLLNVGLNIHIVTPSPYNCFFFSSSSLFSVNVFNPCIQVTERGLVDKGLTDYWGYNTLCFFAPDRRFCSSGDALVAVNEFKTMVRTLHANGIEVKYLAYTRTQK